MLFRGSNKMSLNYAKARMSGFTDEEITSAVKTLYPDLDVSNAVSQGFSAFEIVEAANDIEVRRSYGGTKLGGFLKNIEEGNITGEGVGVLLPQKKTFVPAEDRTQSLRPRGKITGPVVETVKAIARAPIAAVEAYLQSLVDEETMSAQIYKTADKLRNRTAPGVLLDGEDYAVIKRFEESSGLSIDDFQDPASMIEGMATVDRDVAEKAGTEQKKIKSVIPELGLERTPYIAANTAATRFLQTVAESAGPTALGIVVGLVTKSPAVGSALMGLEIAGAETDNLISQGVPAGRALEAGIKSASAQMPLEFVNMGVMLGRLGKGFFSKLEESVAKSAAAKFGMSVSTKAASEGITEAFQTFPSRAYEIWAKNPNASDKELAEIFVKELPETLEEAKNSALVGAATGGMVGAPLSIVEATSGKSKKASVPKQVDVVSDIMSTPEDAAEVAKSIVGSEAPVSSQGTQTEAEVAKPTAEQTAPTHPVAEFKSDVDAWADVGKDPVKYQEWRNIQQIDIIEKIKEFMSIELGREATDGEAFDYFFMERTNDGRTLAEKFADAHAHVDEIEAKATGAAIETVVDRAETGMVDGQQEAVEEPEQIQGESTPEYVPTPREQLSVENFKEHSVIDGPVVIRALHGTTAGDYTFNDLNTSFSKDIGIHFTEDETVAANHDFIGKDGRILVGDIKLNKVMTLPDMLDWNPSEVAEEIARADANMAYLVDDVETMLSQMKSKPNFNLLNYLKEAQALIREELVENGYDAIAYKNPYEGSNSISYMVVNDEVIKDAEDLGEAESDLKRIKTDRLIDNATSDVPKVGYTSKILINGERVKASDVTDFNDRVEYIKRFTEITDEAASMLTEETVDAIWKVLEQKGTKALKRVGKRRAASLTETSTEVSESTAQKIKTIDDIVNGNNDFVATGDVESVVRFDPENKFHRMLVRSGYVEKVSDAGSPLVPTTKIAEYKSNLMSGISGRTSFGSQDTASLENMSVSEEQAEEDFESGEVSSNWMAEGDGGRGRYTVGQAIDEISSVFGKDVVSKLIRSGKLVIARNPYEAGIPSSDSFAKARGAYTPSRDIAYIFTDNTPDPVGTFAHEVGVHASLESVLGRELKYKILEYIKSKPENQKYIDRAERLAARRSHVEEEIIAYWASEHKQTSIFRRIVAKVKAWLFKKFGISSYLSDDAIVEIIKGCAKSKSLKELAGNGTAPLLEVDDTDQVGGEEAKTVEDIKILVELARKEPKIEVARKDLLNAVKIREFDRQNRLDKKLSESGVPQLHAIKEVKDLKTAQKILVDYISKVVTNQEIRVGLFRKVIAIEKVGDKYFEDALKAVDKAKEAAYRRKMIANVVGKLKKLKKAKLAPEVADLIKQLDKQYRVGDMSDVDRKRLIELEKEELGIAEIDEQMRLMADSWKKNILSMSTEEIVDMYETVGYLYKQNKDYLSAARSTMRARVTDMQDKAVKAIENAANISTHKANRNFQDNILKKGSRSIVGWIKSFHHTLLNLETLLNSLDGGKTGTLTKLIFGKLNDARNFKDNYMFRMNDWLKEKAASLGVNLDRWSSNQYGGLGRILGMNAKTSTISLRTTGGRTVDLTLAEALSLYRTLYDDGGRKHIASGGFKLEDRLDEKPMFLDIESTEKLHEFFSSGDGRKAVLLFDEFYETNAKLANDFSSSKFGYNVATVKNYHPLHVDLGEKKAKVFKESSNIEELMSHVKGNISNVGSMKARSENAKAPLIIRDAFKDLAQSISDTATWMAYSQTAADVDSVMSAIEKPMVRRGLGQEYKVIRQHVDTILKHNFTQYGIVEKTMATLRQLFTAGKLGLKLSVVLMQTSAATNYIAYVDDPLLQIRLLAQSIPATLKSVAKQAVNIKNYRKVYGDLMSRSIAIRRRIEGNYEKDIVESGSDAAGRNLLKSIRNVKATERLLDMVKPDTFLEGISFFDIATIGAIHDMAKTEYEYYNPDVEKGSEEYLDGVAKLTEERMRQTQPTFDVENRALIMNNETVKNIVLFASQRSKNYQMITNGASNIAMGIKTKDLKKVSSGMISLLTVMMINALSVEAARKIWSEIKSGGEDDEEDYETIDLVTNVIKTNADNVLIAGDVIKGYTDIVAKMVDEDYKGDPQRLVPGIPIVAIPADLTNFGKQLSKSMNGESDDDGEALTKSISAITSDFGFPAGTFDWYLLAREKMEE